MIDNNDKKKKTREIPLIAIGLAGAAAFWVLEAAIHAFVLDTESFIEALLWPDPNELWMRLVIVSIIVGSSFYASALVTRLRLSEAAIRKERDRAKRYFDAAGVIFVVLGPDGKVMEINRKGCETLGCDKTRIIGRDWIESFVPVGAQDEVRTVFSDLISGRVDAAAYHENPITSDTLGERYIAWQNIPLADENGAVYATLSSGMDITERRAAEESLRYERDKTIGVFNAMEDGVYIVNERYDIEYINPVLEREFGPWKGIKCYRYFHDRTEVCPWCPNKEVFKGNTVRWEWYSVKNGKTYDLIDTPLKNPDGSLSKLEIFRDITKERLATAELKERVEELERFMKATVDRELRMKELSDEIERLKEKKEAPSTGRP